MFFIHNSLKYIICAKNIVENNVQLQKIVNQMLKKKKILEG